MKNNFINNKLVISFLTLSLLTTSFGGVFAGSVLAASPDSAGSEEAMQGGQGNGGILAAIAAVGLIAAISSGGSSDSGSSSVNPGTGSGQSSGSSSQGGVLASEEQQAVQLLNNDRAANGLPALTVNSKLTQLARAYAQDMIARGYFAHNNPEGQTPFDRMNQAGISYKYAGENLAVNTSVANAETAFMKSSGHRANILNANYTQVGIGVVRNSSGSVYVVQEFIGL